MAYGARLAGSARERRSGRSGVGEVEAIAALACGRARLPVLTTCFGASRTRKAAGILLRSSRISVGVGRTGSASLGAHCRLVVARIARRACHTRRRNALFSLAALHALLISSIHSLRVDGDSRVSGRAGLELEYAAVFLPRRVGGNRLQRVVARAPQAGRARLALVLVGPQDVG